MTTEKTTFKCYSTDGENFAHQELHDVLSEMDSDRALEPGMTFHEADAAKELPSTCFDIDRLFEDMGERASDDCGEYAEDFPDVPTEKRAELETLVKDWLDKNLTVDFYTVKNSKEIVLTVEMIAEHHGPTQGATE